MAGLPRRSFNWHDWIREESHRLCKLAGVPPARAHSLRGFVATVAIRAGGAAHLVAAMLGHVSPSTTLQSYALPGSMQQAHQRFALERLGSIPPGSASNPASHPAPQAPN